MIQKWEHRKEQMKPLSVGDLVMIDKPPKCCGINKAKGVFFTITEITKENGKCSMCGYTDVDVGALGYSNFHVQLYRLKRIPPLSELESIKSSEEITA